MTGDQTSTVLQVRQLRVQSRNQPLLSDVSFRVNAHQRLAVLGRSGAGKSILAQAIAGVLHPTLRISGGEVIFPRRQLVSARPAFLMFQNPGAALNPCSTIGDQLCRIARRAGLTPSATVVEAALEKTGMPSTTASLFPFQLSGGMKQKVIFAAALLARPAVLIADEVTTGLDPLSRRDFCGALEAFLAATGAALILISHDVALAQSLCTRALVLDQGKMIADGSWSTLGHQHPMAQNLLSTAQRLGTAPC